MQHPPWITEKYIELSKEVRGDFEPRVGMWFISPEYHPWPTIITGVYRSPSGIGIQMHTMGGLAYVINTKMEKFIFIPTPEQAISKLLEIMGGWLEIIASQRGYCRCYATILGDIKRYTEKADIWQEAVLKTYIEVRKRLKEEK